VSVKIQEREEDTKRLLYAQETVEWPFAMELVHGISVGDIRACESFVGYDVLACVVAFRGAVPEEESVNEC
jgi:hypothetical protein